MLVEGAQIVLDPKQPKPMKMVGHVTSSYWSEALGRSIAMAVVQGGFDRMGDTLHIPTADGGSQAAKVTGSVFDDPAGDRLKVE